MPVIPEIRIVVPNVRVIRNSSSQPI
jgi:hypothetical protein